MKVECGHLVVGVRFTLEAGKESARFGVTVPERQLKRNRNPAAKVRAIAISRRFSRTNARLTRNYGSRSALGRQLGIEISASRPRAPGV
jgi:hypothetical protein